ncbi:two pore domain potassium channel family protein [Lysobacter sp. SG-8]|uniref:Two pore domain potassium channel family protein n=1 Tax=Marilutibacter penaei TaxID=2759900 RepID=A0A7W3U3N9_9GAMM|nr:potassium channel family protein [Lysobacter penaei]MBB1088347.1 two pore domain potassium channel family protein [Lysobacter penaei]
MYDDWPTNLMIVAATLAAVGIVILCHYEVLSRIALYNSRHAEGAGRRRLVVANLWLLALHVFEIWVFGLAYYLLLGYAGVGQVDGMHPHNLFDSIYFSAMVYTTVGFGDMVPMGPIRLLAGTEALVGLMLITWSASFTYLEMTQYWKDNHGVDRRR